METAPYILAASKFGKREISNCYFIQKKKTLAKNSSSSFISTVLKRRSPNNGTLISESQNIC